MSLAGMIGNGDLFFMGLQVKLDPYNENHLTTGSLELTAQFDTVMLRHHNGWAGYLKQGEWLPEPCRHEYWFTDLDGNEIKVEDFDMIYTVLSQIPYTDF